MEIWDQRMQTRHHRDKFKEIKAKLIEIFGVSKLDVINKEMGMVS
jgi:hypothetical protein